VERTGKMDHQKSSRNEIKVNKMSYRIENFENDPAWTRSLGEKLGKIHFRKGHYHTECDPKTGRCNVHHDKHDPHESASSLIKHMAESNTGKVVLGVIIIGVLDQIFTGGVLRKTILKV